MPPPNSVLTATVGEGQLAPPDALHTAVLLKKLLAEQLFENDVIKDALRKKW